jgi:hypothetical protein
VITYATVTNKVVRASTPFVFIVEVVARTDVCPLTFPRTCVVLMAVTPTPFLLANTVLVTPTPFPFANAVL